MCGPELVGVVDDAPSEANLELLQRRGVSHLGTSKEWLARGDSASFLLAVGNPHVRLSLCEQFEAVGSTAATVVHPSAILGFGVTVEPGVIVCAGALVSTNVRLGPHSHVNPGAVIGHDTQLARLVSVNPRAVVSGACLLAEGCLLGAGSVVLQGLRVGEWATVGAAACVDARCNRKVDRQRGTGSVRVAVAVKTTEGGRWILPQIAELRRRGPPRRGDHP